MTKSKELARQKANILKGVCRYCGKPLGTYEKVCDHCAKKRREYQRKLDNTKPWRPGCKGRPPNMLNFRDEFIKIITAYINPDLILLVDKRYMIVAAWPKDNYVGNQFGDATQSVWWYDKTIGVWRER